MDNEICINCGKREVRFTCKIIGKGLCQYCCDKFQLHEITEDWHTSLSQGSGSELTYSQWIDLNKTKCLECEGLLRGEDEEIHTHPESGFGFALYQSPSYKGKKVFSGVGSLLFAKRQRMIEMIGCTEVEDYFYLGESYFRNGEFGKALEQFEKVKDEIDDPLLFLFLGKTYFYLGSLSLAESYLKKAINHNENYAEAHRRLGDLYREQKRYVKSIGCYEDAIDVNYRDPDFIDNFSAYSYFGMALSYSKLGLQSEVIETITTFLDYEGLDGESIIERWGHFTTGNVIDESIEGEKYHFTVACELLTVAYLEADDHTNAERYLNYALQLEPNNSDIARLEGILIGRKYNGEKMLEYKQLLEDIKSTTENKIFPQIMTNLQEVKDYTLPRVWATLKGSSPFDQVRIVSNDLEETVDTFLLKTVFFVCKELHEFSPNITPSPEKPAEEDRYTELFKFFLNQRLHFLGWNVETQSRGGYTKEVASDRGGIGERDLVFRCSQGSTLAIGEALILKGANQSAIKTHVEKIFGYDTTSSNYHFVINWGFSDDPNKVWKEYKKAVVERDEGAFAVIKHGSIEELYSKINGQGIRSFYTLNETDDSDRTAKVIHMYIDIKNQLKRSIASSSRKH
ncbi:tetratricopeptide repeat protein [Paenibacillus sp. NRS-1760]|uniref:tetratricopeptide repeat protein n=1 Tax=Paenibacillus sp. NRS-1760 TaxID=3233902 RepID=UPI003D2A6F1A